MRQVSVDALVYSTSLTHRLTRSGATSANIVLHDGTVVGPGLEWTLNRAQFLPTRHFANATEADRDYATQELYALFTSVLYGLAGRTINRGGPRGLSGPYLAAHEWVRAAGVAGLVARPLRSAGGLSPQVPHQLFVIGDDVVRRGDQWASPPDSIIDGCKRLARVLDVDLLAAEFDIVGEGDWQLVGGSCTPDLRPGGDELLDVLARFLG